MFIRQIRCKRWLATFLIAIAPAAFAEPLGMVTDLTGKAWIREGTLRKPLSILAYIEPGTVVEVGAGGKVSITYYSPPEEYVFAGAAQFQLTPNGPRTISGNAPGAKRIGALAADAAMQELTSGRRTQAAVRMRSMAGIGGMSPNMTTVRTMPSRLSWSGPPGVQAYRVKVFDSSGVLVQEGIASATEWLLPASPPLEAGREYAWQVEATLAGGSALTGKARFKLLAADVARRLAEESPAGTASFAQRLRYALTLEAQGLGEEAGALWRELARERPDEPMLQRRAQ